MAIFAPSGYLSFAELTAQMAEAEERHKRSIPATVFLRHLSALRFQIENNADAMDLTKIRYFQQQRANSAKCKKEDLRKVLYNAWSTEYALRLTANQDNGDFLGFAMHWAIPQAYYSAYMTMHAFLLTIGAMSTSHQGAIKKFAEGVKTGKYPESISFYCEGDFSAPSINGLDKRGTKESLSKINSLEDAHSQIAMLLKSTRKGIAEHARKERQGGNSPIRNKNGTPCLKFVDSHWAQVLKPNEATTLFHFLYRMRLKANYQDIQTFIDAEIDFAEFHDCLQALVGYLNFVHEAYIAKCLGKDEFENLVYSFSRHPSTNPVVIERWEGSIKDILVH